MSKHRLIPKKISRMSAGLRYAIGLVSFLVCAFAALSSARIGLSRLISEYASAAGPTAAAQRALEFDASDPEAHYVYGSQLLSAGNTDAAVTEFERAASLRPEDYFLWLELGRAREDSGDGNGAVIALQQAIKLAPSYSQPRWQLGNVLLRRGMFNEAFSEMRSAAMSDPTLFPSMCDLAWGIYYGKVESTIRATQPQTDDERVSLAYLFIKHNQIFAAVNLLNDCAEIGAEDRRAIVNALINAHEFQAAYRIWSKGADAVANGEDLFDGGFEVAINLEDQGFGWRFTPAETIQPVVDPNNPHSGKYSLQLEYSGNFNPAVPAISQLMLVSPRTEYRLMFAARTDSLISAGLPIVVIKEASGDRGVLVQSTALSSGTNPWKQFSIDFQTDSGVGAIEIDIQRQSCSSNPCPIVGRAWFDSFSLLRR